MLKEIEYDDSPCGRVTLYNYKEPFMEFRGGYGYEGVLLFDSETDKVQCHLCGEWCFYLPNHLHREHNMTAEKYKNKVGLRKNTALIGERTRAKLIASGTDRFNNLKVHCTPHSEESRNKISETLKALRRQTQNETGTCPLQLINRLQNLYNDLGRTPTRKELSFHETLVKVYGSIKEACNVAGIPYRRPSEVFSDRTKWTEDALVVAFSEYFAVNKSLPKYKDIKGSKELKNAWSNMVKNNLKQKVFTRIVRELPEFQKVSQRLKYTPEQLITFLRSFKINNGRLPSYSDCKRGLLPSLQTYAKYFGTFKEAVKLI